MPRYELTVDVQYVYEVEADSPELAELSAAAYDRDITGKTATIFGVEVAETEGWQ